MMGDQCLAYSGGNKTVTVLGLIEDFFDALLTTPKKGQIRPNKFIRNKNINPGFRPDRISKLMIYEKIIPCVCYVYFQSTNNAF